MQVIRTLALSLGVAAIVAVAAVTQQAAGQGKGPLVKYRIVDDDSIPKSLTGKPGDLQIGLKWVVNRRPGNCLAGHTIPGNYACMGRLGPAPARATTAGSFAFVSST